MHIDSVRIPRAYQSSKKTDGIAGLNLPAAFPVPATMKLTDTVGGGAALLALTLTTTANSTEQIPDAFRQIVGIERACRGTTQSGGGRLRRA